MTEPPPRPDPDRLLEQLNAESEKAQRGKLKVFFGFAPGVGKTYRMLQVARELVAQKVDLVVGAVETHGRYDTSALTLGLEILPRKVHAYRGRSLEELDLDLALQRKPKVLLLDELAHTNAPGSRHTKRWQDVVELLDAGIDVFTTLNVQHVESLNDVVAQITGVQVRETVPDSILERADEVELVDVAPEELLARLNEGKVYLPDQVARAASGFFQRGNLLALRELALRRTAERVDADVLAWREQQGVASTWPTSERIMVCVGPAPASARLIRAGRRMAGGLRATWAAVWVEPLAPARMSSADRARLEQHLKLAESLGAQVVRLTGPSVSEALLTHARKANVTRLLIGKPTHSRLRDRLRGSLLDDVVRGSGEIDVHVITGDDSERTAPAREALEPDREVPPLRAWVFAVAVPAATTLLGLGIRSLYPVPDLEMLYLLAVLLTAVRFGRGPAVLAALVSVGAFDFFFVPPEHTFAVADVRYVLTFAVMFGVGLVAASLAGRIRRQERDAVAREERTGALYALSRELATAGSSEQAALMTARHIARSFDAATVVLLKGDGGLEPAAAWPSGMTLDAAELGVAQWVAEHGRPAGFGTDTLPGSRAVCVPLSSAAGSVGVVALVPRLSQPLGAEQRGMLETLGSQAASALERVRLQGDAEEATVRAKTEAMRSSLLSAVSHDLRTPLAAITGAATTLRDASANVPDGERAGLIGSIVSEAERLERLVGNLLDMTRLESGAMNPKREWVPLEELVGSALNRLEAKLGGREVTVDLAPSLPLLEVDPLLLEQVLINLVENATKYTPRGSPLEVKARVEAQGVVIEVMDRGPGLPPGAGERVFEKFYRGPSQGISGAGLGLPICKGIVEAHGGRLLAFDREGGGAVFRIVLPLPKEPPT
ncbi:MAG: sensor histidine kinase KdpD [Myxococcaceae bacterium]|nr:sensor histidine kinase KdpD [Myxococcaceae bacterium]